jgi:expansin (peptidoglycan-binding protein)
VSTTGDGPAVTGGSAAGGSAANDDSAATGNSSSSAGGAGGSGSTTSDTTSQTDDVSATASTSTSGGSSDGTTYGEVFSGGQFHLGPVDWEESAWHNSCSPYPSAIQEIEGNFLAGLELTHNGDGQLCDACVQLDAETGKSIVARVVTTGVTTENSIDLSPAAFEALDSGEFPRAMTWQVVKCPDTGNVFYQFQTEANAWWTSLWVRNARVPIAKVEVQSANHADWAALTRGSDGTYTDSNGFGEGSFTIRVTALDGQVVEDTFSGFSPGDLIESATNFQ